MIETVGRPGSVLTAGTGFWVRRDQVPLVVREGNRVTVGRPVSVRTRGTGSCLRRTGVRVVVGNGGR